MDQFVVHRFRRDGRLRRQRQRLKSRIGDAAATLVAWADRPMLLERHRRLAKFLGERHEAHDLALGVRQLCGDELPEALLDRAALTAVPGEHEVSDVLQAASEALRTVDEDQPLDGSLVVRPVSVPTSGRGRQHTDPLVVANRRGTHTRPVSHLADRQAVAHAPTVNLAVGCNVKSRQNSVQLRRASATAAPRSVGSDDGTEPSLIGSRPVSN